MERPSLPNVAAARAGRLGLWNGERTIREPQASP
jgi:hypothetical protein